MASCSSRPQIFATAHLECADALVCGKGALRTPSTTVTAIFLRTIAMSGMNSAVLIRLRTGQSSSTLTAP